MIMRGLSSRSRAAVRVDEGQKLLALPLGQTIEISIDQSFLFRRKLRGRERSALTISPFTGNPCCNFVSRLVIVLVLFDITLEVLFLALQGLPRRFIQPVVGGRLDPVANRLFEERLWLRIQ